ncbi:MAG: hypothetical protein AAGK34_02890 [Planctomycetota bacterium]
MLGIDVNQIVHRVQITMLVALTGCLCSNTSVHAGGMLAEELADLDQKVAQANPEEAMALRRERINWREQHLEPSSTSARVALDHAEDVLLVHLRSGQNAFRQLWTWPLVSPEQRQTIHTSVRALDEWSAAGMAALEQELEALEQHPDFETDPVLRLDRSSLVWRERDHRGPWLRFLALSYRIQLDRVEDLPIAPRDLRFEEPMPQESMRREAAMWSTRLRSQAWRSSPGAMPQDLALSPTALALFELHDVIFQSTTNRSIVTLDRNALDPQTLELLTPPEQQLFRWLSGEFRFQEQDPWACFDWANLNVLQGMVNAPLSEVGLSNSITPWLKIRGPLHEAGHDWSGLVGARIACLWRCWQGSLRSEWLVEHAPPCGLISIASELAQTDAKRSTDLYERAMREARAEGADLSPFVRASYALGAQAFRAQDMPRAIMMFRQATFAVPIGNAPHIDALPSIPSQRYGITWLLRACAEVAAPDSELVDPELLHSLEPMLNTTEDGLAMARCWVGLGEDARAQPHVERALRSAPESVEVHAAVLAMERQKVARSSPEQRVAKARAARTRLEAFKASFLKPRDLESPEDPVLAGEYRLTNVEVSLALDGPRSAQRIFQEKPWPSVLDHSMLGDRVALEAKVNAELGVSMPEALWDQLDRDPKQVAPVMAGMLRDQLSMADRLRQTFAPEAKQSAQRATLKGTLQSFSRWLLSQEDPSALWLELVADAWLFLGDHQSALPVYEQLLALQSDAAPWLLGQAQCQLNLAGSDRDQLVDPMATFRRLALATSPQKLPKVYWSCQVGMLEILQRIGTPASELWSRVERLRSASPELGGGWYRFQLELFQRSNRSD